MQDDNFWFWMYFFNRMISDRNSNRPRKVPRSTNQQTRMPMPAEKKEEMIPVDADPGVMICVIVAAVVLLFVAFTIAGFLFSSL